MRNYIINLALKFIGTPYIWGGSSPRVGFDCSGFVIWILQIFDILPSVDMTADDLSKSFEKTITPLPGDLCCYGTDEKIVHIGFYRGMFMGSAEMIGANGGDSKTINEIEARKRNAMVKVKPVNYRRDFRFYVNIEKKLN